MPTREKFGSTCTCNTVDKSQSRLWCALTHTDKRTKKKVWQRTPPSKKKANNNNQKIRINAVKKNEVKNDVLKLYSKNDVLKLYSSLLEGCAGADRT